LSNRLKRHDDASFPRACGSSLTFALTLLSGCALIQDEPSQVAIVNPQQAELAQVIHLANSGLAGGPLVGGL
jgi:hypothetical protein